MATPFFQVSRDAARALSEFSNEMRGALALGPVNPWAGQLGFTRTTTALKTTFPIPLDQAGYKELLGDIKYRALYSRSLSMISKEWSDGVKAKARMVEAPDFVDWAGQPSAMALEWLRQPQIMVAALLATSSGDGPLLDFYRDSDSATASTRRLFASDHPFNVLDSNLGTFDNTKSVTRAQIASGAFLETAQVYFSGLKGANGQNLGLTMQGGNILTPNAESMTFKKFFEQDTLVRAVLNAAGTDNVAAVAQNNIWQKTCGYTIGVELSRDADFYCLAAGRPGLYPWVVQTGGAPEEIINDKTSAMYKASREIGVAYIGEANAAACLPHRILRFRITG